MKKVIGFIGPICAGKDEAAGYIGRKLGIPAFQISAPLKEICVEEGVEPTRENLIALGTRLAAEHGDAYLAQYLLERAPEQCIITGMRQLGQIDFLKSAADLTLIAIDAEPQLRFERAQRGAKLDEATTLEEFVEREQRENSPPNAQRLFECMARADHHIPNDGTIDEFHAELDKILF